MKSLLRKIAIVVLAFLVSNINLHGNKIINKNDNKLPVEIEIVKIGEQEWALNNLDVAKFNNGDEIYQVKNWKEWQKLSDENTPAFYEVINKGVKSKLYNFFAVTDPRGIAPEGFHIPSDTEFEELIKFLGGKQTAGNKMKSSDVWKKNGAGTNESGFKALPFGTMAENGIYMAGDDGGTSFWTSKAYDKTFAILYYIGAEDYITISYGRKGTGLSVRCIKNK